MSGGGWLVGGGLIPWVAGWEWDGRYVFWTRGVVIDVVEKTIRVNIVFFYS